MNQSPDPTPKDLFSAQAKLYATFRPHYPDELYRFIFKHLDERNVAWDCATGNGQVATYLAEHIEKVYATDISQKQLEHAPLKSNISYSICPAENTPFPDDFFDLVTVGQALHWFDLDRFYTEVKRVTRPGGVLAAWGYNLLFVSPEIDGIIRSFYKDVVGPYWDSARKLVDGSYASISFPFEVIETPAFNSQLVWTLEQLQGYVMTWSATQHYIREIGTNPVPSLIDKLLPHWNFQQTKTVTFPIFVRMGYVPK